MNFVTNGPQGLNIPFFTKRLRNFFLFLFILLSGSKVWAAVIPGAALTASQGPPLTAAMVCGGPGMVANRWMPVQYWEYAVSTVGYSNVKFATTTSSSFTGPHNGVIYVNSGSGFVFAGAFTLAGTACGFTGLVNLSAISPAFNNNPNVRVRIFMSGAIDSAGTNGIGLQPFTGDQIPPVNLLPLDVKQVYFVSPALAQPVSSLFDLHYQYANTGVTRYYLNVFAMNMSTHNKVWAAQNLAFHPLQSDDLHYEMPLHTLFSAGTQVSSIGLCYFITDSILVYPYMPVDSLFYPYGVSFDTLDLALDSVAADTSPIPITDTTLAFVNYWAPAETVEDLSYKNVPNIDLDYTTNPSDTAYAGDKNACGPASCANSLLWLGREHPGKVDTSLSQRDRLKTLSKIMGRKNDGGVIDKDMIKGKLGFIDKYKLPLSVSFQSIWTRDSILKSPDATYKHVALNKNKGRTDTTNGYLEWDWLWGQMEKGADIEASIGSLNLKTKKWEPWAHAVMLTGISKVKGVKKLTYVHDDNQKRTKAEDLKKEIVTINVTDDGLFAVQGKDVKKGDTIIRVCIYALYSELYDTTVKFDTASKKYALSIPVGNREETADVRFYPNPAGSTLYIRSPVPVHITVLGIDGKMLMTRKHATVIDISDLPLGAYIIKAYDSNNKLLKTDTFLKE